LILFRFLSVFLILHPIEVLSVEGRDPSTALSLAVATDHFAHDDNENTEVKIPTLAAENAARMGHPLWVR